MRSRTAIVLTLTLLGACRGERPRNSEEREESRETSQRAARAPAANQAPRIVSLSPAITETLFAIGAGARVVGTSQYTEFPPPAAKLPVVGTALAPDYEAIARLRPTAILSEAAAQEKRKELEALAPTHSLPWLTEGEILASVRRVGMLAGRPDEAAALADSMTVALTKSENANGPRVLFVLGGSAHGEVFFIRRNSLHGAALEAAGARNAVDRDVAGLPRISIEAAFELDPDAVLIVAPDRESAEASLSSWRELPLRATKSGNLFVIEAPGALISGPRIVELKVEIAAAVSRIEDAK